MSVPTVSGLTYLAFGVAILLGLVLRFVRCRGPGGGGADPREPPGPRRWPIVGNLHLLRGYRIPYQAFVDLSAKFGDVYSLQLGTVPALVVHGVDNIREVLVQKSHHFDSRPNFNRYHQLFHGNKENSLAFCDWSNIQKKRRDLLKDHVFPKVYTNNFQHLNRLITEEITKMIDGITDGANNNITGTNCSDSSINGPRDNGSDHVSSKSGYEAGVPDPTTPDSSATPTTTTIYDRTFLNRAKNQFRHNFKDLIRLIESKHVETIVRFPRHLRPGPEPAADPRPNQVRIKDRVLPTCANIFLRYFCSVTLDDNRDFPRFVENFDRIFYEVNQGYASDFLPFLSLFHRTDMKRVLKHSAEIREFVLANLIRDRMDDIERDTVDRDYVDALLRTVKYGRGDDGFGLETALFSLEDIIGGHSAIGNFLVKLLTFLVDNKTVQERIREEVERRGKDFINLDDRPDMPYTEAVIMEALRMLSSPIVPHVSNQDTTVSGYTVKKDTLVFLNNYELNMSESLWSNPRDFDPTRFINPSTGAKVKPGHFLPFGGGKRSCMGYKLVQFVSFVFLANVVGRFEIKSVPGEKYDEVSLGNLALPAQTFQFEFRAR